MTNFGFVINNRTCIGCHACSTACKSENEVPLGVYRTWVKYTEHGAYPHTQRTFQVTRCNHCANPPCVRICPVTAMYQRDDGIVEFDKDVCIGCKACLQACPYDAIHIDPDSGTAAKCHYCSHRTDLGLEPACVVVCPEHAIIAGDLDDPDSEIRRVLAEEKVSVRKPEQGTAPKLFYIDGDEMALTPTATAPAQTFMWADVIGADEDEARPAAAGGGGSVAPGGRSPSAAPGGGSPSPAPGGRSPSGATIRAPGPQGHPTTGPISFAPGTMAEHMVQVGYNAQHHVPWHWPVPAYLVTKSIGAGAFLVVALAWLSGALPAGGALMLTAALMAVGFIGVTTALLVYDLERPTRFLSILLHPQWKSWLVRGAFILVGFSVVAGLWALLELTVALGVKVGLELDAARGILLAVGTPLAVGTAIYTAFLFGQAEGRDLWQSTLLPVHLLVQAVMMGAAGLGIASAFVAFPDGFGALLWWTLLLSLVVDLFVTLVGEFGMPHASELAATAAHSITKGAYRHHFWGGSIVIGHVAPLVILVVSSAAPMVAAAAVLAILGLYLFEHAFVMAPQMLANS